MGYLFGMLPLIVMGVCIAHVIKTGRPYWWIWLIILVFPIGPLVYFFVEMLPGLGHSRTVRRVGSDLVTIVDPGRDIRKLREQLEISDTVKNRQALARGFMKAGRFGEAVEMYRRCLTGLFKDDPAMTLELAYAHFQNGEHAKSKELLDGLDPDKLGIRGPERDLLCARTLEVLGDVEGALEHYAAIVRQSSGEETRCRYAMLLARAGRTDEARHVFGEIIARARRSPRYYRRAQKRWIDLAKQNYHG